MGKQFTKAERIERTELRERGLKRCPMCEEIKPFDAYNSNAARYDGLRSICRACQSIEDKRYREQNPDQHADWQMKSRYGISRADYDALLAKQNNRCAACGDELQGGRFQHIDHCHESGTVRGILCINCNLALGYLKDDPERITGLLAYIISASGN